MGLNTINGLNPPSPLKCWNFCELTNAKSCEQFFWFRLMMFMFPEGRGDGYERNLPFSILEICNLRMYLRLKLSFLGVFWRFFHQILHVQEICLVNLEKVKIHVESSKYSTFLGNGLELDWL